MNTVDSALPAFSKIPWLMNLSFYRNAADNLYYSTRIKFSLIVRWLTNFARSRSSFPHLIEYIVIIETVPSLSYLRGIHLWQLPVKIAKAWRVSYVRERRMMATARMMKNSSKSFSWLENKGGNAVRIAGVWSSWTQVVITWCKWESIILSSNYTNQFRCRCGYQFCYIYSTQWKTCDCKH
jgi:hypothetical protein